MVENGRRRERRVVVDCRIKYNIGMTSAGE
jgi:hypothetical protein